MYHPWSFNSGGARYPGIWVHPNGMYRFHHCRNNHDFITDHMKNVPKNVWNTIVIGQEIRNSEYWTYFKLNNQLTYETKNSKPLGKVILGYPILNHLRKF